MRRYLHYFIAIVLVVAAVAAVFLATKSFKKHDDKVTNPSLTKAAVSKKPTVKNACTIFTLADAKQLLGDTAKGGLTPIFDSSTDFDVSTCTYTQDQGANTPVASKKSATLLIQAPKTDIGIASNQKEFGPFKPPGVQDLSGYGEQAYWDTEHGQINILKNNIWYILSFGPNTPSQRTLDETRQLADILINEL